MQNSGLRQRSSRHIPAMWQRIFSGLMAVILTVQMVFSPVLTLGANSDALGASSGQTGYVEVTNFFKDQPAGEAYPDLTYVLYQKDPDNSSVWTQIATKTITASDYTSWGGITAMFKFENLDAYTPSGLAYEYEVVQLKRDNYTTYSKKATGDQYLVSREVAGLNVTNMSEHEFEYEAIFYNKYTPDTVKIAGSVDWKDNDNAWNTRADIYDNLVLTRSHEDGSDTQEVPLQQTDSSAYNYFQWTSSTTWVDSYKSGDNYTSFSISNLEKYSYDGRNWVYSLKQDESKIAADSTLNQYEMTMGSLSGTGDLTVTLTNTLKSTASVTVDFEDDGDAYQQRPRVYVELQASTDGGQTWSAAASVLGFGGVNGNLFEQYWTPDSSNTQTSHSFTWDQLPATSNNEFLTASSIIYRVKESKIVYDATSTAGFESQVVTTSLDKDGNYAASTTGVYMPRQTTTTSGYETTTAITNSTKWTDTMLVASKWDDGGAKWLRPSTVTYLLQRKTANGDWQWVTKYNVGADSPFDVYGESLNDNLVQLTLSDADTGEGELSDTWGKIFESLPAVDINDDAYTYRAIEAVPTGYHVTNEGATEVASSGSLKLYAAGESDVTFQNTTDKGTVTLFGIVHWERWSFARPDPSSLDFQLLQYKGRDDTNPTSIPLEQTSLEWASTSTDRWQYSIEGLPKTAEDGTAYYYKFILTPGSLAGYRTENPTVYASNYDGALYGGIIKNTVTRLALDKVGTAGDQTAQLNDVELTVKDASGNVVAVWSRDSQGKVTVAPQNGYTWGHFIGCDVSHIFGLPAGTYTVSETKTPASYLTAADVEVTIAVDGTVTTTSSNATATDSGYGCGAATDLITVSDEALRGGFDVTLTAGEGDAETPVEGMTFDLYKNDGTLLATGLTTDEKGVFTSSTSNIAYEAEANLGDNYAKLSDGLPQGSYYLVETGDLADIVIPTGDNAKVSFSITTNGDATQQPAVQHVTVNNKFFSASVYLTKADLTAESFGAIAGATFELKYKALGSDEYVTAQKLTTDEDGEVWFKGLKKGSYTLTEVSNPGYNVGENGLKALDFVIDNDDADQDRDLGDAVDRASVNATNVDQSIVEYECLVNERLTGTVTMKKVDESGQGIAGAVFKLQVKGVGDTWTDVEGKTSLTSAADGTVTASGLAWGTYRFAEVSPAAGFSASGNEVSAEVTIGRDNVATTRDCGTVTNYGVSLTLKKVYADVNLKGAEFTVTPADGSRFADGTSGEKTFTTGDDGTVTLLGTLAVGNAYVIKESAAPKGYKLSDAELTIKVVDGGAIEVVGERPAAFTVDGATVTMQDEPIDSFFVIKANELGMPISGAEFELSGEFASEASPVKLTVDEYGFAYLDEAQLVEGNIYTLKETKAPAGYKLCSDGLQLKVSSDGKLEVVGTAPSAYTVHPDAAAVVMTDEQTTFTVVKLGEDGQTELAGAEFTVTPAQGSAFADGDTEAKTLTTGDDGIACLDGQLVAGSTYTLAETKAPAGYKQTTDNMTFTVASDGSLVVQGNSAPAAFAVDGTTVAVKDAPVTFSITKVDENSDPLTGATFKLLGSFADGSASQTLTTDENGAAALTGLLKADGTTVYTLREAAAPEGYTLNLNKLQFTVGVDGAITVKGEAPAGYEVATSGVSVVSTDTAIAPVTATIAVSKVVEGGTSAVASQDFSFELRDYTGAHTPGWLLQTVGGVKAGDTASFEEITYTQPGTYKYLIHEKSDGLGLGWTLAGDQYVEVTVLQNEDKSLQAPVVKYGNSAYATSAVFTNRYTAADGEFQLSVKATVNGKAPKEGQSFEFCATATGDNAATAPALANVTTGDDGTVSFSAASVGDANEGQTYTYAIHEVTQLGAGWTAAADVTATVTVGTRGANGELPVTVTYDGASSDVAAFDNTYTASGELGLNVSATVNGGKYATDREFTFGLYETNANGEKTGEPVSTVTVKAGQTVSFEGITYDQDDAGEITYVVSELGELGDGWTKATDQPVKVTVTDNGQGVMTATAGYGQGKDALVFDNTYTAAGELVAKATVSVNGGTYSTDKDFELGLFETDESGAKKGEAIATATVKAGQVAILGGNFFGQDDAGQTITYVVSELGELGDGWTKAADQLVKVTVTDNGQGTVVASVDYGQGKDALAFNNIYAATGTASIAIAKMVNSTVPADNARFSFSLAAVTEGAPMPKVTSATTMGAATASFGDIAFDLADAGKTYEYSIHETTPSMTGWTMADDVTVRVTVGDDAGDGTLKAAKVEYSSAAPGGSAALFDNTYKQADGQFQLALVKTVNGSLPTVEQAFTFSATAEGDNADAAPRLDAVTTDEDGSALFSAVTLSDADEGKTYTYRIHETSQLASGWTAAPDVIATVQVSRRSSDNKLVATVTYKQDAEGAQAYTGAAAFDNKYVASAELALNVTATANGGAYKTDREFTFGLFETDGYGNKIGNAISTVTVKAGETASFKGVTYDQDNDGDVITYVVSELSAEGNGWTNAADQSVDVAVADNGDGTMSAEVSYAAGQDSLLFDNTYACEGELELNVAKTVNGGSYATDREFEFGLFETDADGEKTGEPVSTVKVRAGQTATLRGVFYDLDNAGETIGYVVSEISEPGAGWTNAPDQAVAVKVTDDLDGTMTAAVAYPEGQDSLTFDNTYSCEGELELSVTKTVNGGSYATDKEFELGLYETDESGAKKGEPVSTVKVRAGETATLKGVFYDLDNAGETIAYVVSEISEPGAGWTNAADQKVAVTVVDDLDGTMTASVAYPEGQDSLVFDNTYSCEGELSLSVTKTVNGGSYATDREFELGLFETDDEGNKTGEPVSTAKVRAGQTATLKGVFYDLDNAGETIGYVVSELTDPAPGWTNAPDQAVAVKVTDDLDGTMTATPDYGEGKEALTFDNAYACEGELSLSVTKTVNGGSYATDREFELGLFETDDEGNKTGEPVSTAKVRAGQTATLRGVFYDLDNAGETIDYAVSEISEPGAGWTNAPDQKVAVTVADDLDGTMTASVAYPEGQDSLVFDNKYACEGELALGVSKTVNGGSYATDREFELGLFETDESGEKTGEPVSTVKVRAGQTATLKGVFYDLDNAGETIDYVVSEISEPGAGWTNAPDQKVTVRVADDLDGTMIAAVAYPEGQDSLVFDNTYACEGELELSVTKTVNGGSYATDREFEFGLFETDDEGEKTGEPVSTVKVRAGQTATLKGVFYDLDNAGETIDYAVSEISEPGAGWTNAADQKVAVTVTDDLDGTMTVAPDYGEGKTSLVFDNTYKATVNPDDPDGSDGPVAPDGSEAQKPAGTPQAGDASASALYTLATAGLFLVAASIARRRRNQA